jgi:hypothetical protein
MSFYQFRFEQFHAIYLRGRTGDVDLITFTILINQRDRGHGSNFFYVGAGSIQSTDDFSFLETNYATPPTQPLNMTADWMVGPFEIAPDDNVVVIYTGTNTSDSSLANSEEAERFQLDVMNTIAVKGVALIAGIELGEELGEIFSEGFRELIADPVGDLIGWVPDGPCNGAVFADAIGFTGRQLDNLAVGPLTHTLNPRTDYAKEVPYEYPGVRFTKNYTDAASHNTERCGDPAETDVTYAVFRLPYISVKDLMAKRFPNQIYYHKGMLPLGQPPNTTFGVKEALGILPKD